MSSADCHCPQSTIDREALMLMCEALSGREVRAQAHSEGHYERIAQFVKGFAGQEGGGS